MDMAMTDTTETTMGKANNTIDMAAMFCSCGGLADTDNVCVECGKHKDNGFVPPDEAVQRLLSGNMTTADVHGLIALCERALAGDQDAWWLVKPLALVHASGLGFEHVRAGLDRQPR
jgi:hypothetical protein